MALIDDVKAKVKDTSGKLVDPTDFDSNISEAISIYSKYRPREVVEDITGDGGHDYALPTAWDSGFSHVRDIEYPVDAVPETMLEDEDWKIYRLPAGEKLRLINATPAATETFRVRHTALHTEATIPAADIDAVANLAAALCCEMLANAFAMTGDPAILADAVNYHSKSGEFSRRAKQFRELFNRFLGIRDGTIVTAASAVKDNDVNYPWGGDRLTHQRRYR